MAELTVRMPALSATMEDAELLAWLVSVGDEVRTGQSLAEVTTDKVDMELESPHDGVVAELLAEPGTRVDVGAAVATLTSQEDDLLGDLDLGGDGGETQADAAPGAEGTRDRGTEGPGSGAGEGEQRPPSRPARVAAPPPVRKRARSMGIDLAEVTPTGSRGQVTNQDLQRHLRERAGAAGSQLTSSPEPEPRPEATDLPPSRPRAAAISRSDGAAAAAGSASRRRAIRLATARTTIRSAAVPQFTLHRRLHATLAQQRRGGRSWVTEVARALAAALWRHPECNAIWDSDAKETVRLGTVRIGIAVDTDDGLVVVGVDDPDADDPEGADDRVRRAVERARNGRIVREDREGLSSTISNLGGLGVDRFDALLIPPQPTILSVGRLVERPVVVDGRVRARPTIDVGLTVDHRVADGADGARLLDTFARRFEG